MDKLTVLPDKPVFGGDIVSDRFLSLGINRFIDACRYIHTVPYGYNSNRDDPMILFKENKGTCTTKHAVIAALAKEMNLPIKKNIGIYALTEEIVTGTNEILAKFNLPYVPMIHCYLVYGEYRVDLSEGNNNGKNRSIEDFLYTEEVEPNISAKNEYLLFRKALQDHILTRKEMAEVDITQILHAREEGLKLLKHIISQP
jgi:hypothetical protein